MSRYKPPVLRLRPPAFSSRAHIIGVSVSETMAETATATLSVMANSRNSRPDDAGHEQQRDEHRDQRDAQRDDREADLLGALERRLQRRFARSR